MPRCSSLTPRRLNAREPAVTFPNGLRDRPCRVNVIGVEVDVERDERPSCTDRGGAGRGMRRLRPEVGSPDIGRHLLGKPLELSPPDRLERAMLWSRRRLAVKEDGDRETVGDGVA